MSLTPEQAAQRQIDMFGCTEDDLQKEWESATMCYPDQREMYVLCILSDAQEVLEHGNLEQARQWINKAKWHLIEMMETHREPS